MKRLTIIFLTLCISALCIAQDKFEIRNGKFLKNGEPVYIIGGELHYARIPKEYWRHRIQMAKAMGINTLSTYVFWNAHEPEEGMWDFSGMNDVAEFIRIAGEEGLMVLLRPGPYVCAEWDYGGLPWWLQTIDGMKVRQNNEPYLEKVRIYLEKLYEQVKDLLITNGGPIIMVQCENEFGSLFLQCPEIPEENHRAYMSRLYSMMKEIGYDVPFYTADGAKKINGGRIEGVLTCVDGERVPEKVKEAIEVYSPGGPYFISEFYPGWLSHWGEKFSRREADVIASFVKRYFDEGIHFNYFMIHGGTNFGFTSGANYTGKKHIQPDITSYDYDAPISEAGWDTEKYHMLRNLTAAHLGTELPDIPERIPVIEIPEIQLTSHSDVLDYLYRQERIINDNPLDFESLHQGHGYVLYSRHFNQPEKGILSVSGLRDYATVYLNGEKIGELNRMFNQYEMEVDIPIGSTLDILVENLGRINFDAQMLDNHKGIIEPVLINGEEVIGEWQMRKLPMSEEPSESSGWEFTESKHNIGRPQVYSGVFKVNKIGDTFLNMTGAGKGIVFINGHNIGRFWDLGPQQTLYIPGVWMKKGKNKITIFEQSGEKSLKKLRAVSEPILDELKTE